LRGIGTQNIKATTLILFGMKASNEQDPISLPCQDGGNLVVVKNVDIGSKFSSFAGFKPLERL
jgi:hypothetical protein